MEPKAETGKTETEKKSHEGSKEKGDRRSPRPYPNHTLEEVIKVARAIQDNNAGKPMKRLLLAEAVGRTPGSSEYRLLLSSSYKYGLTIGTEKSEYIDLTPLGTSIVNPTSEEEQKSGYAKAALNPEFFNRVFSHFNQNKLPSENFLKSTLEREFNLSSEWSSDFIKTFISNGKFAGIIQDISGSPYVMLDLAKSKTGNVVIPPRAEKETTTQPDLTVQKDDVQKKTDETQPTETRTDRSPREPNNQKSRIFISHSNNQEIVEQIKTMLDLADIDFEVAEEEESAAIPVTEKVLSAMRKCNAAVICVTADESEKRENNTHGINQNVLIEIGAAFVLYDKKVVLVWDKAVSVPSNLQGLYRCEFTGDELSWTSGMKLMKAVSNFKVRNSED